ncbi:MAG: hypothetical protein OEZ55_11805, partial [Nitrospinota bacterium]|nr:hypothetical protein [Nitrospinota bacterium]
VYMLWMFQRVMFGKITNPKNEKLTDVNAREIAYFAPLIALVFILGIFPTPVLQKIEPSVINLVNHVHTRAHAPAALEDDVGKNVKEIPNESAAIDHSASENIASAQGRVVYPAPELAPASPVTVAVDVEQRQMGIEL